jgi:hypothetical protein
MPRNEVSFFVRSEGVGRENKVCCHVAGAATSCAVAQEIGDTPIPHPASGIIGLARYLYTCRTLQTFAILAIAVTGLALLQIGVNAVISTTSSSGIVSRSKGDAHVRARFPFSSSAEMDPVKVSKNIIISNLTKYGYVGLSISPELKRFIANLCSSRRVLTLQRIHHFFVGRIWEEQGKFVSRPRPILRIISKWSQFIHLEDVESDDCPHIACWSLPGVLHSEWQRESRIELQELWSRLGHVEREARQYPSSLIFAHSLTHYAGLPEISKQGKHRDEYSSSSGIKYLIPKKAWWIFLSLCHVILLSIVGMFLARKFLDNYLARRLMPSLFFLALVAVSAAHVLSYLIKLVGAISTTLIL